MRDRVSNDESNGPSLVCVIDDDPSLRRQLQRQLRHAGHDVEVFESGAAFRRFEIPSCPTCLVLDVRLSGFSGIDLYQELKQKGPPPPVIFLTGFGGVPLATRAMKDGAVDFLEKPVRRSVLLAAVAAALELSRQTLLERSERSSLSERYESLTRREREVMDQVVTGQLNKQAAFALGITESTIKVHRARVMQKMGADSLADLTLMALALGRIEWRPMAASLVRTRQTGTQA